MFKQNVNLLHLTYQSLLLSSRPLAFSSVFIVSTVAISTWTCILLDVQSPRSRGGVLDHQPGTQDFLIAYGIIAFQVCFICFIFILHVFFKMQQFITVGFQWYLFMATKLR